MKTKLTLYVIVLAAALIGVGCVTVSDKDAVTVVGVDYELALPLVSDGKGKLPWTNRDYRFHDVPDLLDGYKYYQYTAQSGNGVTLNIKRKSKVIIVVGASQYSGPREKEAISKLENEEWEKIESNLHYLVRSDKHNLQILSKVVNKGKLRIKDNSEFGGIIVLTK